MKTDQLQLWKYKGSQSIKNNQKIIEDYCKMSVLLQNHLNSRQDFDKLSS